MSKSIAIHSILMLTEEQKKIKDALEEARKKREALVSKMAKLDQQKLLLKMQVTKLDKETNSLYTEYTRIENKQYEIYE